MSTLRTTATATLLTLALALTGCSSNDDSGPDTENSPTTSDTPTNTTPTATEKTTNTGPEPIPTNYPDIGLEFTNLPDLEGKWRNALQTYVNFERGRRKLTREAKMNPLVTENAMRPVIDTYEGTVTYLQDNNAHYRGDTTITIDDVQRKKTILWLELCTDGTALRLISNGDSEPIGNAPSLSRIIVTNTDAGWRVSESINLDGNC